MAFSDAIFAFSITLLVVTIDVPQISPGFTDSQMWNSLKHLWPQIESYVISFLVIGTFWISHHQKFRYIRCYNKVWLRV